MIAATLEGMGELSRGKGAEATDTVEGPPKRPKTVRVVTRLLSAVAGGPELADEILARCLLVAARTELPPEPHALMDFCRAYLLGAVTLELGPQVALELMDDLATELGTDGASPAEGRDPRFAPEAESRRRSAFAPASGERIRNAPRDDRFTDEIATAPGGRTKMGLGGPPPLPTPVSSAVPRAAAIPSLPTHVPPVSLHERRAVLLVDGDRFGRSALARALVRSRFDVTVVDDAPAALDALDNGPFDIVLLDFEQASGRPVLLSVRSRGGDAMVFLRAENLDGARAFAEGAQRDRSQGAVEVYSRTLHEVEIVERLVKAAAAFGG